MESFFAIARITSVLMPKSRFAVMSAESVILDLIYCLENSTMKQEKRIKRLLFMVKFFSHEISPETEVRLILAINRCYEQIEAEPVHAIEKREDDESLLARLFEESTPESAVQEHNDIVFDKRDPLAPFVPPLKQVFNDSCKSAVNRDGKVYDIFAAVATVAFYELLSVVKQSPLRKALYEKAKMVFKGGASIGKFLFQQDKKLWDSMLEDDKQFVIESFINGGDNDTTICFGKVEGYSVEEVNNEIAAILYDMQLHMLDAVKRYHVERFLEDYLKIDASVEFAGQTFTIEARKGTSFHIVERNEHQMELLFLGDSSSVFGSVSYLEFPNSKGEMIKFFLARLKAGYKAVLGEREINCYSELLDVSACCADSAKGLEVVYKEVKVASLFYV
jgi:hypothetical protein